MYRGIRTAETPRFRPHSNASVVLPDSAAGDNALRFRVISELPGIEGRLAEGVRKRHTLSLTQPQKRELWRGSPWGLNSPLHGPPQENERLRRSGVCFPVG